MSASGGFWGLFFNTVSGTITPSSGSITPSAYLADSWLSWLGGTSGSAPAGLYLQLHTGPPGPSGTANVSSVTTRESLTLGTPVSGSVSASGLPAWNGWAGTDGETDSHVSLWDAPSAGNFLHSAALSAGVTVHTGDTLAVTVFTLAFTVAS